MSVVCFSQTSITALDKKVRHEILPVISGIRNTALIFYRAFQTRLVHAPSNLSPVSGGLGLPRRRQRPLRFA